MIIEHDINQINLVGWGDIPIELILKIQKVLEGFYAERLVVLFDPKLGLFLEIASEQDEVISWVDLNDLGIVDVLDHYVLPEHLSIIVDLRTGKSPGLIFHSRPDLQPGSVFEEMVRKVSDRWPNWLEIVSNG